MIMINYRLAKPEDEAAIAKLHAESWQKHYRGIFSDAYLDEHVVKERADLWAEQSMPKARPLTTSICIPADASPVISSSVTCRP